MQLDHYSTHFNRTIFPITLICDNVTNAPNIGSLFRAADAFGIEKLIFCGDQISLGRKMTKTSRATEKSVPYEIGKTINDVIDNLKNQGFYIVALEITSKSTALCTYQFPKNKPIALVVGDENFGISETILKMSDAVIHINMFGQNSSMNVVQAAGITLYEITKQIK